MGEGLRSDGGYKGCRGQFAKKGLSEKHFWHNKSKNLGNPEMSSPPFRPGPD